MLHEKGSALFETRLVASSDCEGDTTIMWLCVLQEDMGGRSYVRTDYFFRAEDAPGNYAAVRLHAVQKLLHVVSA